MNLRFLKKQDGTKVLQYEDMKTLEYKDVPMVEETTQATDLLMKAFFAHKDRKNDNFIILVNENFSEKLIEEYKNKFKSNYTINFHELGEFNSFCGHRVYITKMISNFKFVREL
jgi:hypothetical protein